MDYTIRQDGEFKYLEEGQGPTLILLHGLFGALSNWKEVIEYFKPHYKVVIPMLPIFELPILSTGVKELMKFVHRFVTHKGYANFALVGNSLGGHVALVYVKEHPEMVNALVLTGSSGLYENAFGGSTPRKGDKEYIRKKIEVTFYDPKHATDELVEECYEILNDRNKLIRIVAMAKSAIRHNMAEDLAHIKQPTCLIWGKNDVITPPEVAVDFNKLISNSDLYWIDHCGHAAMMEHPQEFNSLLKAWLEQKF
jgi:2-hydroxy-6-oxonona-2,4-dienedioate hydrolase